MFTVAAQYQPMATNGEIKLVGNFLLQSLYLLILEFDDTAAPKAHEMIMMSLPVDGFITCPHVIAWGFPHNSGLKQEG
jgi:hypothetical protein